MALPLLGTVSWKDEREQMLSRIKKAMDDAGPKSGNFYLWLYEVSKYKFSKPDVYRQTIEMKYKDLCNESKQ